MSSPNDTDGLDERPRDPREDGRDNERGGERGEVRWEPLDIYSDSRDSCFAIEHRVSRIMNGPIATLGCRWRMTRASVTDRSAAKERRRRRLRWKQQKNDRKRDGVAGELDLSDPKER